MIMKKIIIIISLIILCFSAFAQTTTVHTPTGVNIEAIQRAEFSQDDIAALEASAANWISTYSSNAVRVAPASATYNCHNFAWHSSDGGSQLWINQADQYGNGNISKYWSGTSPTYQATTSSKASKVFYPNGDHSAKVINPGLYESKWGYWPRYRHTPTDCPYTSTSLQYYYIPVSGNFTVCSSESYSTLNIASATYSWSGSGVSISSSGSTATATKIINGSAWVQVQISSSLSGTTVSAEKKTLWAGTPPPLDIRLVDGTTGLPKYVFCLSQHNGVHAKYADTNAQVDLWDWDVTGGVITYDNPYGGDKSVVTIYPNTPSTFNVKLNAHNACGWSGWTDMGVGTMSCGTYSLALTPNPVTAETTVSIESDAGEELSATDQTSWDLEVYNVGHQLKMKKVKIKGRSTTINTSGLKEGVYIVRVEYKDTLLTEKMIVKK